MTLEAIVDMEMFMKLAPASVATALANIVLPVPGGPNSKRPLHGCAKHVKKLFQKNSFHCIILKPGRQHLSLSKRE